MPKHPGGRPPKVTETSGHVEKAWFYTTGGYLKLGEVIPTVEGLAVHLELSKETLYTRSEFSDVLVRLKSIQAVQLISGGLSGKYSAVIAKLLLASKHDYVEKSATDLTTKGKELPTPILGGLSHVPSDDGNQEDTRTP